MITLIRIRIRVMVCYVSYSVCLNTCTYSFVWNDCPTLILLSNLPYSIGIYWLLLLNFSTITKAALHIQSHVLLKSLLILCQVPGESILKTTRSHSESHTPNYAEPILSSFFMLCLLSLFNSVTIFFPFSCSLSLSRCPLIHSDPH